jgi:hypothetical protein
MTSQKSEIGDVRFRPLRHLAKTTKTTSSLDELPDKNVPGSSLTKDVLVTFIGNQRLAVDW